MSSLSGITIKQALYPGPVLSIFDQKGFCNLNFLIINATMNECSLVYEGHTSRSLFLLHDSSCQPILSGNRTLGEWDKDSLFCLSIANPEAETGLTVTTEMYKSTVIGGFFC